MNLVPPIVFPLIEFFMLLLIVLQAIRWKGMLQRAEASESLT
jgi:hypothetical protein